MTAISEHRYVFKHAAEQNKAIAESLENFSARSRKKKTKIYPAEYESSVVSSPVVSDTYIGFGYDRHLRRRHSRHSIGHFLGLIVLVAGLIAIGFVVGPAIYDLIATGWKTILLTLGGVFVGSGFILIFRKIDKHPLKNLKAPDSASDQPLTELENLADRTVARLKIAYQIQLFLIFIVGAILLFVVLWALYLVTTNKLKYATAFGSSGLGMLVLSKWKWQPFERVSEARKLADDADILAAGLRLRIKSISEIIDPKERAKAQWEAVSEYLDRS